MSFIFTVCQVGAEKVLKQEIDREHPDFKFAFSRPGFITFKSEGDLSADFKLNSVFARAYGLSVGKRTAQEIIEYARTVMPANRKLRIHAWERDQFAPGEEPLGFISGKWKDAARAKIKVAAGNEFPSIFYGDSKANVGDTVLDVIVIEEDVFWLGFHKHSEDRSPYPGGQIPVLRDDEAPSRAYYKLEEAIEWSGAVLSAEDTAVEIGSAPGGACYALLKRGLRQVMGIDPGKMDPRVLKFKNFIHIPKTVAEVGRGELPRSVQWLLLDLNVPSNVSLFAVDHFATRMKDSLLGVFLTVKLNDWKMAKEIPHMLEHVRAMGMTKVRATQLPSNKQEIFIFGLTKKGSKTLTSRNAPC